MKRTIIYMTALLAFVAAAVWANKNFLADWTFRGSALTGMSQLGDAAWSAENGEIVGRPKTAAGGWLVLQKSLQDVQFAADYKCAGGCRAGLLLRAEKTAGGMKGVLLAASAANAGGFLQTSLSEVTRRSGLRAVLRHSCAGSLQIES